MIALGLRGAAWPVVGLDMELRSDTDGVGVEIHWSWGPAYKRAMRRDPCCYCGAPVEHLDHITPRSRGGDDGWWNLTGACARCNTLKRETSLLGFLLWLDDEASRLLAAQLRARIARYRAVGT